MQSSATSEIKEQSAPTSPRTPPVEAVDFTEIVVADSSVVVPLDVELYIIACKGNVYQSCGDDELSILQYLKGWSIAAERNERDWEVIFINSIGLLVYYNMQFALALKCFDIVCTYRQEVKTVYILCNVHVFIIHYYCILYDAFVFYRRMVYCLLILLLHGTIVAAVYFAYIIKPKLLCFLNKLRISSLKC